MHLLRAGVQQIKPYADAGRIKPSLVPVAILDHEDQGRSSKSALALLAKSGSGVDLRQFVQQPVARLDRGVMVLVTAGEVGFRRLFLRQLVD